MRDDITELLIAHGHGRSGALERLVPLVYNDLRRLARAQLLRRPPGQSLDTTGLVHEAYLKLVDHTRTCYKDRGHFFAVSALAMRQILVDQARRRQRLKRTSPGGEVPLEAAPEPSTRNEAERVLDIDRALGKLAGVDPRLVRVVECRYFAGLSEQETAEALGVSLRTAQREWFKARAWLRQELEGGTCRT